MKCQGASYPFYQRTDSRGYHIAICGLTVKHCADIDIKDLVVRSDGPTLDHLEGRGERLPADYPSVWYLVSVSEP